jgi:hypothetical protein
MSTITDFTLAAQTLKHACEMRGLPFVNLPVFFDDEKEGVIDNSLFVSECVNIAHTHFMIVIGYVSSADLIFGQPFFSNYEEEHDFLVSIASLYRDMLHPKDEQEDPNDELFSQRLYQRPFIWLLMKSLFCPVEGVPPINLKIVCGKNPYLDVARFYSNKTEIDHPNAPDEPFIYVNETVTNDQMRNAYLLIETLKAHGLNPLDTIKKIFEGPLSDNFVGVSKLAFGEDDCSQFLGFLSALVGLKSDDLLPAIYADKSDGMLKIAQTWDSPGKMMPMMWWYLGLTEKMLQPARGADWSTYEALQKYNEELWEKFEKINKKKRQGEQIPFNMMLKIKREHTTEKAPKPDVTIQSLLSSQRVWR